GIRKRLLEYDNVMNQQREIIYARRRNALFKERLRLEIFDLLNDYAERLSGEIPCRLQCGRSLRTSAARARRAN
ncbi:MAG: hypothetical protein RMI34_09755, partial [Chloroherpetonaceae bacterium]|nr:hypothetical protein [Chloroherpetonaceae bacterium]